MDELEVAGELLGRRLIGSDQDGQDGLALRNGRVLFLAKYLSLRRAAAISGVAVWPWLRIYSAVHVPVFLYSVLRTPYTYKYQVKTIITPYFELYPYMA
jgi:hypothetical protein